MKISVYKYYDKEKQQKNWLYKTFYEKMLIILVITSFMPVFMKNVNVIAQDSISKQAFEILDNALKPIVEENNVAIYYQGIAYGLTNPLEIFSLPAYKLFMGGYWIIDGNKFEMQLGYIKGISDGTIYSIINEEMGIMYIDSVNNTFQFDSSRVPDLNNLLDENFGKAGMSYLGVEMINGTECHKIKSTLEKYPGAYSLYWVDKKTGRLLLMADWQNNTYDVYWVQKITGAPKSYDFSIHLPNKEMSEFHGYEVIDMRFSSDFIQRPIEYEHFK